MELSNLIVCQLSKQSWQLSESKLKRSQDLVWSQLLFPRRGWIQPLANCRALHVVQSTFHWADESNGTSGISF